MSSKAVVRLFLLSFLFAVYGRAQVQTGMQSHGTFISKGADTINVGNNNVVLNIPVLNKAGRGLPLSYNLTFNSSIWYPSSSGSGSTWEPVTTNGTVWGWQGLQPSGQSGIFYAEMYSQGQCSQTGTYQEWSFDPGVYIDNVGGTHGLHGNRQIYFNSQCSSPQSGWVQGIPTALNTRDDSGYQGNMSLGGGGSYPTVSFSLSDSHGTAINPPAYVFNSGAQGNLTQTDSNGNTISSNNGQYTDTTGTVGISVTGTAPSNTLLRYNLPNSGSAAYTVSYRQYTVATNFQCGSPSDYGPTPANLVDRITLPDNSFYQFTYEPTAGMSGDVTARLQSVQLPTGGTISYTYGGGTNGIVCADGSAPGLTRVTSDGTSTYNRAGGGTVYTSTVTDEQNNQSVYHFSVDPQNNFLETHRQAYQSSASGTPLQEVFTCYNGATAPCDGGSVATPITEVDATSAYNGGSALLTKTTYDPAGVAVTNQAQYNGGALLTQVATPYSIIGSLYELLSSTTTDGSGNFVAETKYGYDETSLTTTSVPQHVSVSAARGNITSVQVYTSSNSSLTTTSAYYDTGQPISTTDPGGFTTTFGYDSTQAFLTSTHYPTPSSGVALSTSAMYDAASGALIWSTGMNGDKTTINSYDGLLRVTSATLPSGSAVTRTTYSPTDWIINQTANASGSQTAAHQTNLDGYGRVNRVGTYNGQSSNNWYQEDYCFDGTGNIAFMPQPYQSTGMGAAMRCSGPGTTYNHDALGRLTSVQNADGTNTIEHSNRAVKVTDVNASQRIMQYDLLGQLTGVCELTASIDGSTGAGQASGPNQNCGMDFSGSGYTTIYTHSLAQHSLNINAGGQQRTFVTDAAGRTTSTIEPEGGATTYTYNYNPNGSGLVLVRRRPQANQNNASVTTDTTTQYDALGRPVSVSYSDGTPTKQFLYDAAATNWAEGGAQHNMAGRLALAVRATSAGTAGTLYTYDTSGNIVANYECTPSACGDASNDRSVTYGYDLSGTLTNEGDGAGNFYTLNRSAAGEVTGITNQPVGASSAQAIITSVQNSIFGPTSYGLGNGLTQAIGYDALGRRSSGTVCPSGNCSNGSLYGFSTTWHGSRVSSASDSLEGSQTFGYDQMNRLTSMAQSYNGNQYSYQYVYDRWGNRWQQNALGGGPSPQMSFDVTTNHSGQANYDAAGNEVGDGFNSYTYDADGNVTQVNNGQTAVYTYDALNQRVRIQRSGANYEFTFDQYGHRVSTWNPQNFSLDSANAYWDGRAIALWSGGSLYYEHQDWIGTERVRTNASGQFQSGYYSLPFGDGTVNNGTDLDWYHFAGTERDAESNTQHAQFRQYSSTQGRWMSPDPYNGSYDLSNPQTMNRYSYAGNNPLSATDPSGLVTISNCVEYDTACGHSGGGGYTTVNEGYSFGATWNPVTTFTNSFDASSGSATSTVSYGGTVLGQSTASYSWGNGWGYLSTLTGGLGPQSAGSRAPSNFQRMPLPGNHLNCTTSTGVSFPAPPGFSVSNIAANGAANGLSGAGAAVGQGGYFDFQRFQVGSVTQFFSGYTPVANVAVGAYVQGTGAPQWVASTISNVYAFFKSSNGATAQQGQFRNLGFSLAAGKGTYSCQPSVP